MTTSRRPNAAAANGQAPLLREKPLLMLMDGHAMVYPAPITPSSSP